MSGTRWTRIEGIEYASRETGALALDLYLQREQPADSVLYVHGGGWLFGSRSEHRERLETLAGLGVNVVSVDYRTSNLAPYPAQHEDLCDALRWLELNGPGFGLRSSRFVMMGASAGAHIVALTAFSSEAPKSIAGMVGLFGRYDLTSAADALRPDPSLIVPREITDAVLPAGAELGATARGRLALLTGVDVDAIDDDLLRDLSPVYRVPPGSVPIFLAHGDADAVVHHGHSLRLAEAARRAGASVTMELIAGANHEGTEFDSRDFLGRVVVFTRSCTALA